jgi:hypothetical protein
MSTTSASAPVRLRDAARLLVAAAATGAGAVHIAFAPAHIQEWLPLGVGFLLAGVVQVLWGVHISRNESSRALLFGAAFSALFVGVYVMSRTTGLPLGPEAFEPEGLGAADILCCTLEVLVIPVALLLRGRPRWLLAPLGLRFATVFAGSLLLVGGATTYAVASPAAEHTHVHPSPAATASACPSSPVLTGVKDARGVDTGVTAFFSCKLLHEHDGHAGH